MGGVGSGRPPSEKSIIKRISGPEVRTPIGTDIYLPNHSGIATHPEAIKTFQASGSYLTAEPFDNLSGAFYGHSGSSTVHFTQGQISITESQISDLQNYIVSGSVANVSNVISQGAISGSAIYSSTTIQALFGLSGSSLVVTAGVTAPGTSTFGTLGAGSLNCNALFTMVGSAYVTSNLPVKGTVSGVNIISSNGVSGSKLFIKDGAEVGDTSATDTRLRIRTGSSNKAQLVLQQSTNAFSTIRNDGNNLEFDTNGKERMSISSKGTISGTNFFADNGFTGSGTYTNFTISGGVILAAS